MAIRFMPMPAPHPMWSEGGGFPVALKVPFRNGKVRTYILADQQQPAPNIMSKAEIDRLFAENGGYKPKHAKKDR